eukprot:gene170-42_t
MIPSLGFCKGIVFYDAGLFSMKYNLSSSDEIAKYMEQASLSEAIVNITDVDANAAVETNDACTCNGDSVFSCGVKCAISKYGVSGVELTGSIKVKTTKGEVTATISTTKKEVDGSVQYTVKMKIGDAEKTYLVKVKDKQVSIEESGGTTALLSMKRNAVDVRQHLFTSAGNETTQEKIALRVLRLQALSEAK